VIGSKKIKFRKKYNYWYVKCEALREQRDNPSSTVKSTAADVEVMKKDAASLKEQLSWTTAHRDELRKDRGTRMFEVTCTVTDAEAVRGTGTPCNLK
jgi:phage host-nuclease inhibitor protein Gam